MGLGEPTAARPLLRSGYLGMVQRISTIPFESRSVVEAAKQRSIEAE
jgi:hypothetical protein